MSSGDHSFGSVHGPSRSTRGTVSGLLSIGTTRSFAGTGLPFTSFELNATLVVFSNGGGAIFGYLPQATLPGFERYWLTPTGLNLAGVALRDT